MSDPGYKIKNTIGAEKREQLAYNDTAKARKGMAVAVIPSLVVTAVQATAGFLVGKGNVCRIFGTAADLVGFYPSIPGSVPLVTDQNAAMLGATVMIVVATDEFIRTTSGVTRVEVTED